MIYKYVKLIFLFLACPILNTQAQQIDQKLSLDQAKQIMFLGNSITYAGQYVSLFESYLLTQFPHTQTEVINVGLPSETVSGLSEDNHADGQFARPCLFTRLDRVMGKLNPDIAFACYGINDGIYLPFDNDRFDAFKEGMLALHQQLEKAGVKRVVFLSPPVHDDPEKGLQGYNLVLDRYTDWLLTQREERGWEVIDLHYPMNRYINERRKEDPSFKLAADGVHPDINGHRLIAQQIIAYFDPDFINDGLLDRFLDPKSISNQLFQWVEKSQNTTKNAWLTYTGHERPGLPQGVPLAEAMQELKDSRHKIAELNQGK